MERVCVHLYVCVHAQARPALVSGGLLKTRATWNTFKPHSTGLLWQRATERMRNLSCE